jgi:hypothetical protein
VFTNTARGHIVVDKVTDPSGDAQSFSFNTTGAGYAGFNLTDTQAPNDQELVPGAYSVTEAVLDTWDLTDLSCVSNLGSIIDTGSWPTATITLAAGDTVTCTFTNTLLSPEGESTDSVGVGQDTYFTDEDVYATGSGFRRNSDVDVYIVGDRAWTDGDPIPADVSHGVETVATDGAGNLGPALVWPRPLTPGEYDMVFDANQNGVYDAATDVVDDPNHPGFVVRAGPQPIGGSTLPMDRRALLSLRVGSGLAALAALTVALAGLAVALVRRRRG